MPPGSIVVSANLTLNIYAEGPGIKMVGRYLMQPWLNVSDGIGSNLNVGWRFRCASSTEPRISANDMVHRNTSASQWAALGALGEGTDLVAGKQFVLPPAGTLPAEQAIWTTNYIDTDIVQSWISNPDAMNYGIRFQADLPMVHSRITQHQRQPEGSWRPVTLRPKLTIQYTTDPSYVPAPKAGTSPLSGGNAPFASGAPPPASSAGAPFGSTPAPVAVAPAAGATPKGAATPSGIAPGAPTAQVPVTSNLPSGTPSFFGVNILVFLLIRR